jgi:hypothetical protein
VPTFEIAMHNSALSHRANNGLHDFFFCGHQTSLLRKFRERYKSNFRTRMVKKFIFASEEGGYPTERLMPLPAHRTSADHQSEETIRGCKPRLFRPVEYVDRTR